MYLYSRQGQLVHPPNTMEIAKIIGKVRCDSNVKTRASNPEYDMGTEENKRADNEGVFAELIAQHFFFHCNRKVWTAPLYADKKQTGSDINLLDINGHPNCFIDVKSVKKAGTTFNVNRDKFQKNKMVDTYFFVQQALDHPDDHFVVNYWVIDAVEIETWEVKTGKNGSAFFSRSISDHEQLFLQSFAGKEKRA